MPRYANAPTDPTKIRERAKTSYKVRRTDVWIDPYPTVPGTKPEKMVYARLTQLGIPFQFQEWLDINIKGLASNKWYRPDFMLPDVKIIIQVQGTYWHTQPDRIVQDSFEAALFELAGWKVLFWWDYDIYSHLDDLIAASPVAAAPRGAPIPHKGRYYNDLAGLRTLNSKRRKPWTHKAVMYKVKRRAKRVKPAYSRAKGIF